MDKDIDNSNIFEDNKEFYGSDLSALVAARRSGCSFPQPDKFERISIEPEEEKKEGSWAWFCAEVVLTLLAG